MMHSINARLAGVFAAVCLLAGCNLSPEPHYHWGSYEKLILDMYVAPGNADPVKQIDTLTADIQQAQAAGKPVPPGVYAHLGYMYAIQGNIAQSRAAFEEEKALYPESAVLVDGMIDRAFKEAK